jgi:hypothetical protein
MWAIIAQELKCSIDEAEAWHFKLGQEDLARRVCVTPFTMTPRPRAEKRRAKASRGNPDEQPSDDNPDEQPSSANPDE